jgi:peptidoglycan/xylan/chitin deacetylase (PgdA/CDA1 family)
VEGERTAAVTTNGAPLAILTYHQIDHAPAHGTPFRSLVVTPQDFVRQMQWLRLLGYRGLAMRDLLPYLRGERQGRVVGITFDDGYRNNLEHALPVLLACGFTATCYAVAERLGGRNDWDAHLGVPQKALMTVADLRAWTAAGMEVGAHGMSHADLTRIALPQAEHEIRDSRHALEDVLAAPVRHYCYPYGAYQQEHTAMARTAGFVTATTTRRGRCHAGADWWQLPRVPVLRTTSRVLLWSKIATGYEDRRSVLSPGTQQDFC